ncbi:MAG: zinc ribbon domain-containing protein [Clostridiaceae bacterium]|nr:zinc ribbon domain-containing protein [Clostridiaceae bacterium]
MYCIECGESIKTGDKFCGNCGEEANHNLEGNYQNEEDIINKIINEQKERRESVYSKIRINDERIQQESGKGEEVACNSENESNIEEIHVDKKNNSGKSFKRIVFGIVMALIFIIVMGIEVGFFRNPVETKAIKEMVMDSGIKLGDLIEAGVSSPTYELYDPAEDGNTYVTIKGDILYHDIPVEVAIQYKKVSEDEDGSRYEFHTVTYNDIPRNQLQAMVFFEYLHQEYEKKHSNIQGNISQQNTVEVTQSSTNTINYTNSRFGYSVDVPKIWGEVQESHSGDGAVLYNMQDILDVRVYASYMMEETFDQYIDEYVWFEYFSMELLDIYIPGASHAVYHYSVGEASTVEEIIAEKDGVVYTFRIKNFYFDDMTNSITDAERERINQEALRAMESLEIF